MSSRNLAVKVLLGTVLFAQTSGLFLLFLFLGKPGETGNVSGLLPIAFLLSCSFIFRWALLPRFKNLALFIFACIAGQSLACAAGILAIFVGSGSTAILATACCLLLYFPLYRVPEEKPNLPPQLTSTSRRS